MVQKYTLKQSKHKGSSHNRTSSNAWTTRIWMGRGRATRIRMGRGGTKMGGTQVKFFFFLSLVIFAPVGEPGG